MRKLEEYDEKSYEKYERWDTMTEAFIGVLNIICLVLPSCTILKGISMMADEFITGFNLLLVGVAFFPGAIGLFVVSRDHFYEAA